jgi:hypothetical protein
MASGSSTRVRIRSSASGPPFNRVVGRVIYALSEELFQELLEPGMVVDVAYENAVE